MTARSALRVGGRRRVNPDGPAAGEWRRALLGVDESEYDRTGLSSYPYGSDADETFPSNVWWLNQEILHHRAEIALLRDLYRHQAR